MEEERENPTQLTVLKMKFWKSIQMKANSSSNKEFRYPPFSEQRTEGKLAEDGHTEQLSPCQ